MHSNEIQTGKWLNARQGRVKVYLIRKENSGHMRVILDTKMAAVKQPKCRKPPATGASFKRVFCRRGAKCQQTSKRGKRRGLYSR